MRIKRSRFALAGVLALALGAFAGPGTAQAAKATETAPGGILPDAILSGAQTTAGEFVQTFRTSGKKVKKKQTLDVSLTVNAVDANGLGDVSAVLYRPKGEGVVVPLPFPGAPTTFSNLRFRDQSNLVACDPAFTIASNCNYFAGGVYTGDLGSGFNPTFAGLNPKGTWTLVWMDTGGPPPADVTTIGESELKIKTGKKFAKE